MSSVTPSNCRYKRGQASLFGLLREFQIRQLDAVGRGLNVSESHLARHRQNFEELWMDRRLAAGELHHATIDRTLAAQRRQHAANLLQVRLIQIARGVSIGEAYRTRQIAAVSEVDVGQRGVRGVHAAQAAIVRTRLATLHLRIRQAKIVAEVPLLHLEIELDVAEDDVAKLAVLGAALFHYHFAVFGEDIGHDHLVAFRTERFGLLRQVPSATA